MAVWNAQTMLPDATSWATWSARGYAGRGNVEGLIDKYVGRPAIVVGSGSQVFIDLCEAETRVKDPIIFAVNDIGMYLPRVDHWVSLHYKNLKAWKSVRWLHPKNLQEDTYYHSIDFYEQIIDYSWQQLTPTLALSGYFAMQIAYIMGCEPIVLAGCPGTHSRRFFDKEVRNGVGWGGGASDSDANIRNQLISEMQRLPEFKKVVRSMSGWTKEYFGKKV